MVFRLYVKPNFYTGYLLTKSSFKLFCKNTHNSQIVKQLEECMANDLKIVFKENLDWTIESWISTRINRPHYIILTHHKNYVASFRYHFQTTNKLYNTVKVIEQKYIFISIVLVNSMQRGKQICSKLLGHFVKDKKYSIVLRVLKDNYAAIKCYEKVGFTCIGSDTKNYIYFYAKS